MREAIGGISLFQIVIVFVLLFTGVMALTINHSRAFGVKDEIINIIETSTSSNLTDETLKEIGDHLRDAGYRVTGSCDKDWVGYDLDGKESTKAAFCIKNVNVTSANFEAAKERCSGSCDAIEENLKQVYYKVAVFYQLDIPVLNKLMNFKMYGSTKTMWVK